MAAIKKSTTYNRVFYLSTSSGSACTGALGGMTTMISKNGNTFNSPVGTVSEVGRGFYYLQLNTSDVDTLGDLAYSVTSTVGAPATPVPLGFVDQVVNKPDPGDASGLLLTSAYDFAKGTVAVTESYAANTVAPTPIQALLAIHQMLMSFNITSTTLAVKKLDNSTSAFNATLNSASTPTAISRT